MELRQALESNDLAEIRSKSQALEQAAQPLAQGYAQANEQAASASSGQPAGDGGDTDEVVEDAELRGDRRGRGGEDVVTEDRPDIVAPTEGDGELDSPSPVDSATHGGVPPSDGEELLARLGRRA